MPDNGDIRVLVLTNMYPTAAEPHLGCFVRDQVCDLRVLGADVRVQAFDGRRDTRRYLTAAATLRRPLRRDRFDRAEARRELGWPRDGPCILFPAARGDRSKAANKRVDVFDATVERLRARVPGVHAASLDGLPRDRVALAMRAADVAVLTSVREGAPVAVKEALACETPVVSVAVGDVPGLIRGLPGGAI